MNRLVITCIALILIAAVLSAVIFFGPVFHGDKMHITDAENDVLFNVGSTCPGMIDLKAANFTRNNDMANITLKVREPFTSLGSGEFASWEILLVLENETDIMKTYVVRVEANATGSLGSFSDVATEDVKTFQVTPNGQWLNLIVPFSELQSATIIEWNIESTYKAFSGDTATTDAYDAAPDQGVQTTALGP
jgi:hypothetical protein